MSTPPPEKILLEFLKCAMLRIKLALHTAHSLVCVESSHFGFPLFSLYFLIHFYT